MRNTPPNAREQIFTALDFLMALPSPEGVPPPRRSGLVLKHSCHIQLGTPLIWNFVASRILCCNSHPQNLDQFMPDLRPTTGLLQARHKRQLKRGSFWGKLRRSYSPCTSRPQTSSKPRSKKGSYPSGRIL